MIKTEYRTKNDGYWDFLQYKYTKKNIWGKKVERWSYILDAKFDSIYMLKDDFGFDGYVCSYNHDLHAWIEKYPNIDMWIKERKRLLAENYQKRSNLDNRIKNNKGKIKYL